MADRPITCAIWPNFTAFESSWANDPKTLRLRSERAGGKYAVNADAATNLLEIEDKLKARLTTWLVDQRNQGVNCPLITCDIIDHTSGCRPLSADEKVLRALRFLGSVSESLGQRIQVSRASMMAWAECSKDSEIFFIENYLKSLGWITSGGHYGPETFVGTITIDGHRQIVDQSINSGSTQAFVAMWFDNATDRAYFEGIEPALIESGYQPLRIDRKEHVNKIEDEIVAEIRRSRFVVADFTHGEDGARGGVYYEAGFAHGLGIPVILCCHAGNFEQLHFDTNHYNHIAWLEPNDLRRKLKNRVLAVMGEGPGAPHAAD